MPAFLRILNLDEKKEKEDISDYEFTCQTIISMGNIVTRNLSGKCYQARPLRTSSANKVSPDTDVKPDVVVEAPSPPASPEYRAINEIKANIPQNQDFWSEDVKQLQKYDDELSNWTRTFPHPHDIMFTTNELRTYAFHGYLQSKGITFERKFSILHSTRMAQSQTFMVIKKDFGDISNVTLDEKLSNGVAVNTIHLIEEFNQMKFYDAKPPIVYTMMIIWDHVLKNFLDFAKVRELRGRGAVPITVSINQVRDKLARFAPETNNNCVEIQWVKDALDGFCELGIANIVDPVVGKFEIRFRPHPGKDWIFEKISEIRSGAVPAPSKTLDEFRWSDGST